LAPGSQFHLSTGAHSHNVYLQTWYETGAVGAALLLLSGLLIVRELAQAPQRAQPYLYSTFATCALLGGTSFGLWQPWFMASFGLVAAFAMLGWVLAHHISACDCARS
jgi:O-antigen ligase